MQKRFGLFLPAFDALNKPLESLHKTPWYILSDSLKVIPSLLTPHRRHMAKQGFRLPIQPPQFHSGKGIVTALFSFWLFRHFFSCKSPQTQMFAGFLATAPAAGYAPRAGLEPTTTRLTAVCSPSDWYVIIKFWACAWKVTELSRCKGNDHG